jgi:predicted transcriptional regulator
MKKYKEDPRYNVLSLRISDEEMAAMGELQRQTQKSISMLMREAMQLYTHSRKITVNQG